MSKWLGLLKSKKALNSIPSKGSKGGFEGFEGEHLDAFTKYPAVWTVTLVSNERHYKMTVIDPERLLDSEFASYLADKFGHGRVLSCARRN